MKKLLSYIASCGLTCIGDSIVYIALPAIAASGSTDSKRTIALIVAIGSLGRLLGPAIGYLLDIFGVRKIMFAAVVIRKTFLLIALLSTLNLGTTIFLAASNGIFTSALTAANTSAIKISAPEDKLIRINSFNSVMVMGAPLVGYAVGGIIIQSSDLKLPILIALLAGLPTMALTIFLPSKQISTTRNKDDKSSLNLKPILGLITIGFAFNCLVNMVNVRAPLHFLSSEIGYSGYGFFETILGVTLIAGLASAALGAKIQQSPRVVFAIIFSAIALSTLTISLLPDPVGWFTLGAIFGLTIGYGQVIMMTQLQLRSLPNQIGRLTGTLVGGNSLGLLAGSFLAGTPLSTQLLLLSACAVAMAASMTLAKSPKAI